METALINKLILTALVFVLSFFGTLLMIRLGNRNGWLDAPRQDRWHDKSVALYGGVGFGVPILAGGMLFLLFFSGGGSSRGIFSLAALSGKDVPLTLSIVAGAALMFLCGLWDDKRGLGPGLKLIWQVAAASLFIYAGGVFPISGMPLPNLIITYLWIVGLTNAVNMLDNMDGLASGIAVISALTLAVLSAGAGLTQPGFYLSLILAVGLLGFWVHNRPPAKIFMGDSGSLLTGYLLAVLSVPGLTNGYLGVSRAETVFRGTLFIIIPAAVMSVFIFDGLFVTITRFLRAIKIFVGGRDHSSHRLARLGLSDSKVLIILYSLAVIGGIAAVVTQRFPEQALPLIGLFIIFLLVFGIYLGLVSDSGEAGPEAEPFWKKTVGYILVKRNTAVIVLDVVLVAICLYGAYLLRFEFSLEPFVKEAVLGALPLVVACCLLAMAMAGGYGDSWRLASVTDLSRYAVGAFLGTAFSLAAITFFTRFERGNSRAAFIIFGLFFFLAVALSRFSFRILDRVRAQMGSAGREGGTPVLIFGSDKVGKFLCEEILYGEEMREFIPLGFIAEEPRFEGKKICGLPVKSYARWKAGLDQPPEIWIASSTVTDQEADDLARSWDVKANVRRYSFNLKNI